MKENQKVFHYNGSEVSFKNGDAVMINATQMAKPFGKTTKDWLRLQSTQEFINTLGSVRHICLSQLIVSQKGNTASYEQGTWMHEDVAMEFARWLSPQFAIWCNDRIKELMRHGVTATPQTVEELLNDPDTMIRTLQALKEERAKTAALQNANQQQKMCIDLQNQQLVEAAPKVDYYDNTLQSVNTMTTTQVAKELGMTATALNRKLKQAGVLFMQSGQWMVKAAFSTLGLTKTRTQLFTRNDGSTGTTVYTVWTQRGRRFILELGKNGFNANSAAKYVADRKEVAQ